MSETSSNPHDGLDTGYDTAEQTEQLVGCYFFLMGLLSYIYIYVCMYMQCIYIYIYMQYIYI